MARSLVRRLALSFLAASAFTSTLPAAAAVAQARQTGAEILGHDPGSGQLIFVGPAPGRRIGPPAARAGALPEEANSRAFIAAYARALGLADPGRELRATRVSARPDGRTVARYRQVYRDVPVFGADVIVNTSSSGELLALSSKISQGLSLSTAPTISPEEAVEAARLSVAREFTRDASSLTATAPELSIYDGRMLGFGTQPAELVWKLEVRGSGSGSPLNALVLVDAQNGGISLQFNQIDTSWRVDPGAAQRVSPSPRTVDTPALGLPQISVYTMKHSWNEDLLPGWFVCDQSDSSPCFADADADNAYRHAFETYDFYWSRHGRDSIGGAGMGIISSVHFGSGFRNAYWDDTREQMVYGDRFPTADDVVAHELTHGVTQHESNLWYYGQPGAISESFSDLWGEFVDQTNSSGTDTPAVRWLIGEDLPGGAVRNMKNPPAMADPDKMTSGYYYLGYADGFGVHTNSGVNNKAVFLMVDGGTFNGRTIAGLGLDKTEMIYYEAQTNLLGSGANYLDLYYALRQACVSLIGTGGITDADCQGVREATDAVEMNKTKSAAMYPTVDYCPGGQTLVQELFWDDFESGAGNWAFGAESGTQLWLLNTTNFDASSGVGSLCWGPWCPGNVFQVGVDSHAAFTTGVLIPPGPRAYLRFEHDFNFDCGLSSLSDGGVVEYSVDGGAWGDLGSRFSGGMRYNGTIVTAWGSDLDWRKAFTRASVNYTASRYDLGPFAGQSFKVRFRAGSSYTCDSGWFVDDVRIYTCVGVPALPALLSPAANALLTDPAYRPILDWSDAVPDIDHYDLQVATDSGFTSLVVDLTGLTASDYPLPFPLDPNASYYWRVSAHNLLDQTKGWTVARTFRTALLPPELTGPTDGAVLLNKRPTFAWDATGATGYTLQVARDPNFATVVRTFGAETSPYAAPVDLPADKVLWWRARSTGANGPSLWSDSRSFHTANPPGIPLLVSPALNALTRNYQPLLDWSSVTVPAPPASAFDHYRVQVNDSADFSSTVIDEDVIGPVTASSFTPPSLAPNTKYYWRVSSYNALGEYSAWSAVRYFRTALPPPTLLAPANGSPLQSRRPALDWEEVLAATGYTLQISRNAKFTLLIGTYGVATPGFTPAAKLPANSSIWWRVRSKGQNGPSAWSAVWNFKTGP